MEPDTGNGWGETALGDLLQMGMNVGGIFGGGMLGDVASSLTQTLMGGLNPNDPVQTLRSMGKEASILGKQYARDTAQNAAGQFGRNAELGAREKFGQAGQITGAGQFAESNLWNTLSGLTGQSLGLQNRMLGKSDDQTRTLLNSLTNSSQRPNAAMAGGLANALQGGRDDTFGKMLEAASSANAQKMQGIGAGNDMHNQNIMAYKQAKIDPYAVSRMQQDFTGLANNALNTATQTTSKSQSAGSNVLGQPLASAARLANIGGAKDWRRMFGQADQSTTTGG